MGIFCLLPKPPRSSVGGQANWWSFQTRATGIQIQNHTALRLTPSLRRNLVEQSQSITNPINAKFVLQTHNLKKHTSHRDQRYECNGMFEKNWAFHLPKKIRCFSHQATASFSAKARFASMRHESSQIFIAINADAACPKNTPTSPASSVSPKWPSGASVPDVWLELFRAFWRGFPWHKPPIWGDQPVVTNRWFGHCFQAKGSQEVHTRHLNNSTTETWKLDPKKMLFFGKDISSTNHS